MSQERIVITPSNPEHSLETIVDPIGGVGHSYLDSLGVNRINEVADFTVKANDKVRYHIHKWGSELFTVTHGSLEAILGGKRTEVKVGDIMLIRPSTPHAFLYKEDGTSWQEVLQRLPLWDQNRTVATILKNCPEKLEDEEFMTRYRVVYGREDYPEISTLDTTWVEPCDLPGLRQKGDAYKFYKDIVPGIECRIKFTRWEMDGVKEIWEYVMDKDVTVSWDNHYPSPELFAVREGSVRVEAQGFEPQIAKVNDFISIRDYTTHRITALEPGTVIQDFNCEYNQFLMMEELEITKRIDPGKINEAFVKEVMKRYDCPITEISGVIKI